MIEMDEKYWVAQMVRLRWPNGWRCGRCGGDRFYNLEKRPRMLECAKCTQQKSVTADTIMHKTRLPLAAWFFAMSKHVRRWGISARRLARMLKVRLQTAWRLLHRLRAAVVEDPVLRGVCSQELVVQKVVEPAVYKGPEVAFLTDQQYQARIIVGTPRVDRRLGLQGWDATAFAFIRRNGARGRALPYAPDQPGGFVSETVLAPGAEVRDIRGPWSAWCLWHSFQIRARRTHRHVSGRWLARYTGDTAWLWPRWRAHLDEDVEGAPDIVEELARRCLAHGRRTFTSLVPGRWRVEPVDVSAAA